MKGLYMYRTTRFRAIICGLLACSCFGWAERAAASGFGWGVAWGLTAKAAATAPGAIYALDANDFVPGQGYRVRLYVTSTGWWHLDDGRATSIAVDGSTGTVAAVALDNAVWYKDATTNWNWVRAPRYACEGGNIYPRQVVGDNNVARADGETYVLTTRVRKWNGSCWEAAPALPAGGIPTSIAQSPFDSDKKQVWVSNQYGEMYNLTPAGSWEEITTGIADELAYRMAVGADGASIWGFNTTLGTFYPDSSWVYGPVTQIGTTKNSSSKVAIGTNGRVYWWGYRP